MNILAGEKSGDLRSGSTSRSKVKERHNIHLWFNMAIVNYMIFIRCMSFHTLSNLHRSSDYTCTTGRVIIIN